MATEMDFKALAEELGIEVKLLKPIRDGGPLILGGTERCTGLIVWIMTSKGVVVPPSRQHPMRIDESEEGLEHFFSSIRLKGCFSEFVEQTGMTDKKFCWMLEA